MAVTAILPLHAQEPYPSRPIRMIVPVAAGGFADVVARAFALKMSANLGQPIVIENRPSNGSIVGTQFVAKAPADGYTLLVVSNTFSIVPALSKEAGYDPVKDFAGVGLLVRSPMLLVTGSSTGINSVADLIAEAKQKPGTLPYASGGTGSTSHIPAEIFLAQAGITMIHVPYKGNAPAMPDVVAGRVSFILNPTIASISLIKGGQLKALATTSIKRSPLLPDVPSLAELGFPEYDVSLYAAIVAPAGVAPAVLDRLNASISAANADPDLRRQMVEAGNEVPPLESVSVFNRFMQGESTRYARVIRERGIKAE